MGSERSVDVLVTGPDASGDWCQDIVAELFALGYETRGFSYRLMEKRLAKLGSRRIGRLRMNRRLVRTVRSLRPRILLALKGESISASALKVISQLGTRTANWFPDDPHRLDLSKRLAVCYDFYFTHCTYAVDRIRKETGANAFYLPLNCTPLVTCPVTITADDRGRYGSDVCFLGGYDREREQVLSALVDLSPRIWGPGWDRSRLARFWAGRGAYGIEMVKAMACAKISLNVHRNFGGPFEGYGHGANRRVFDVAGSGSFQLCDRKKDIEAIFEEGAEVAYYETPEEALEKARYYLAHESERLEAVSRCRAKVLHDHSLRGRLQQALGVISGGSG